jgi:hypothetical protein
MPRKRINKVPTKPASDISPFSFTKGWAEWLFYFRRRLWDVHISLQSDCNYELHSKKTQRNSMTVASPTPRS